MRLGGGVLGGGGITGRSELTDDERVALLAEDPQDAQGVLESLSPEELEWLRQNEKGNVDDQFLEDMRDHCATRSVFKQPGCYAAAEAYHQAVSQLGGKNCGPLFPGRLPGPCASENG